MAVADDGLAGTMRPQRWVVEVPRSRDMSKDAVLLALAEGAEMGPFAELALVAVVSTVPLKHGKGGADVPQSKADPSALAAEQRRVEDSVLRPFLTLAATKEVRAFAHVECCDSNKTGLCRAVQRFQAAKLFLNTRKNFSLLQRSSSSLAFFESHLPRGITILVVKGGKKVSESLSTGERVETTRDYLVTRSFTIQEDDDDSDTNSVGSARSTRSAPMALQSSDRRIGRVVSDNSVGMFAATTIGGSMRHGVQAGSSASSTGRSSMVGDGGGDGSSANPFQRFRKGFGSMGAQTSLGGLSSNMRRKSFEREQQPNLASASAATAGAAAAAAARLSGLDSDESGSSRLSSGQLYSVDFPWAGGSDDGRSLDGSVHGAHSRNPSSISGGGGGVSREMPLLGGVGERGVGSSGTSIPSGPGWPAFASASAVGGGSNRDPNGAISAESSAHDGSVFEKFSDGTSPRPCPPHTEDSSLPMRSAAVAAVGAAEAGGGAGMGTGPPPRPPRSLSPASSSSDLRSPSLTPSSSFRVSRGIAMDSPERPPIPRPPSGNAAALSPVLNVAASAAAADGEAGKQAVLLAEIAKLRAATAAAQQAAAAAEQEAQRAKEESLRLVSQLPGASAGPPLAATAAAAAATPLHLPSLNVSKRRTLKEELEMELAEFNGEDEFSVGGYGMGLDMSNLNVRVQPLRTDSLTSLSAIAPALGGSMRYSRLTGGTLPDMEGEDDDVTCAIRMPLNTIDSSSSGIKRGAAAAFAGSSNTFSAAAVGSIAAPLSYTQGLAVVGTAVPSSSDGSPSDEVGLSLMGAECRHFSAAELLTATNDFSAKNLLGRGSYGPVYRGELHGCAVAVKRREKRKGAAAGAVSLGGEGGAGGGGVAGMEPVESLEFRTEVEVLSRLRHPHIVLLMGHCPEDASIVYEYLPGGNLQDRLHPGSSSSGDKQVVRGGGSVAVATPLAATRPPLLWPDRFRIAAEITSALLFLHRYDPPIIHRDLKPDNILLDANDLSKISDVGLARLLPKERCEVSMKVQGTIGFIDPEVLQTGEISVKVDVYSLGLILILLVTSFTSVKQIHNILKDCSPHENGSATVPAAAGAADESGAASPTRDEVKAVAALLQHLDPSAGDWPRNLAAEVLRTAVRCIERCSALRPDLGNEVQPGCAAIAKAAREERERRLASADAKFFCPLSKERMQDPVVAADGFTYERKHIERWLETSNVSPSSGEPLAHKCLAPNRTLHELMLSSV